MKSVLLLLPLAIVAAVGCAEDEQCYDRSLSGWQLLQPRVASAADGRMVVVWQDGVGHVTAVAADGTPGTTRELPSDGGAQIDVRVQVASGPDSHLLVDSGRILALDADGQPLTPSWQSLQAAGAGRYPSDPDVIWDGDSFVLAWQVQMQSCDRCPRFWQMRVARVDGDGRLRGAVIDVPGATSDEEPLVHIARTGSVLWLVWSADYWLDGDAPGFLRGMRLAPDLSPLDLEPIAIAEEGRLRAVAFHEDRALLLAKGDQPARDLLALVDEDGVVGVESVSSPVFAFSTGVKMFPSPDGGYQVMEAASYDAEIFPRSPSSYRVIELDASGHQLDGEPRWLSGSSATATAGQRGTVFAWAEDEGTSEGGTSRIRLQMADDQAVTVFEKVLFMVATEVPCPLPPPPSDHNDDDDGCGEDDYECYDVGCSTSGGRGGLAVAGTLVVAAVVATRRRRS
jgi:hypothetical protein